MDAYQSEKVRLVYFMHNILDSYYVGRTECICVEQDGAHYDYTG